MNAKPTVSDLSELLATMEPRLNEGTYAYASLPAGAAWPAAPVIAMVQEAEGITVVAEAGAARAAGWPIVFEAAWITLSVHSDLQAIGFTAAIAAALSEARIPGNVIAAVHHDHLFVPFDSASAAMERLQALQRNAAFAAAQHARRHAASLRGIAYVSTAVAAMPEGELEALLIESRELNRQSGVTGVLLYSDGNFLQYFEGSEEAMRVTYERIRASRRHKNIIELLNEPVAERSFEDWQMGFSRPTYAVLLTLSSAQWERQAELARSSGSISPGMDLLLSFWSGIRP